MRAVLLGIHKGPQRVKVSNNQIHITDSTNSSKSSSYGDINLYQSEKKPPPLNELNSDFSPKKHMLQRHECGSLPTASEQLKANIHFA